MKHRATQQTINQIQRKKQILIKYPVFYVSPVGFNEKLKLNVTVNLL